MKTTLKLTVIAALMAMSVTPIIASTNSTSTKTIWVQALNFTLTAWEDGTSKPVKIGTKDIIQKLNGLPSGDGSNALTFTKSAQLLSKVDTTGSNNTPTIVVRDGKPKVDTDVTGFFSLNPLVSFNGNFVTTISVSTTTTNSNSKTTDHSLNEFDFEGDGLSFDLAGATTGTKKTLVDNGGANVTQSASANVLGSGVVSTSNAVIEGKVSLGGGHLEAPQ